MSGYDYALLTICVLTLIFLPIRYFRLRRIKEKDQRLFFPFWGWPIMLYLVENIVPLWMVHRWLFQVTEILIVFGLLLDFFYYFGLKTEKTRLQVLNGLLVIPYILLLNLHWFEAKPVLLTAPYLNKAMIWTDHPITPHTFYFMEPTSSQKTETEKRYDDPNYGKAVFSPLTGRVAAAKDGVLTLENEEVSLEIGPLVVGSYDRLVVGAEVFANQHLGLLDNSDDVPGICVRVAGKRPVRFVDVVTGRWFVKRYKQKNLRRNALIMNDSEDRFKLQPVTQ